MAITIGTTYGTGASGWTTYGTPLDTTAVFYVADASHGGSDANSGLMSGGVVSPVLTLAHAYTLFNNAYNLGKTPWVLFRKDSIWIGENWNWNAQKGSGTVVTPVLTNNNQPNLNPIVISSYDPAVVDGSGTFCTPDPATSSAARPLFKLNNNQEFLGATSVSPNNIDNVIFSGLEFYAYQRDPGPTGSWNVSNLTANFFVFDFQGSSASGMNFMLWENCKSSFFDKFVGIQQTGVNSGMFICRRNIAVDTYQAGNVIQKRGTNNFYSDSQQFSLIENVIDNLDRNPTFGSVTLGAGKSVTLSNDGSGNILVTWPDQYVPQASPIPCSVAFTATGGNITAGNTYHTGQTYTVKTNVGTAGPYTFTISDGGLQAGSAGATLWTAGSGGTNGTYTNVNVGNGSLMTIVISGGAMSSWSVTTAGAGWNQSEGFIVPSASIGNCADAKLFAVTRQLPWTGAEVTSQTAYWTDPRGNEFGHPYYFNSGTDQSIVQNNIISRIASGAKSGSGQEFTDNLHLYYGWTTNTGNTPTGSVHNFQYNVSICGEDQNVYNAGNAMLCATLGQATSGTGVDAWHNNIYAHAVGTNTDGYQINDNTWTVSINDEIVFNLGASIAEYKQFDSSIHTTYSNNNFDSSGLNTFDATNRPNEPFSDPWRSVGSYYSTLPGAVANNTFTGAITGWASGSATLTVSAFSGTSLAIGDSVTWSGQSTNVVIKAFGTGSGGNGTYTVVCGGNQGSTSMSGWSPLQFITAARGLSKANWNSAYTANSVNNYIRAGFGQAAYPAGHRGGNHLGKF